MRAFTKFIFVTFLLFDHAFSHPLTAQSPVFLEGVVSDEVTSEPVAFAQIKLKFNHLTIYSNSEGTFRLPKNSVLQSDSIIITGIGYKNLLVAFHDLNDREINKIFLTPLNDGQNVKVSARDERLNSISILRRAIGNLSSGNPDKPFSYISYYRDYLKKDGSYLNMNEAIIQTFDNGFLSASVLNVYRILDFRKNQDLPRMNMIPVKPDSEFTGLNIFDKLIPETVSYYEYGNELLTLLAQDPIRNFNIRSFPFVEILSQNFIDNHNFSPPSETFCNNLRLYKITFNGKTAIIGDSLLVSGAIYIQPDNYSIHKLEYSCYNYVAGIRLKKLFSINLEYGKDNPEDSLMRLRYISMSRRYNVYNNDDKSYFRLRNSEWHITTNISPSLTLKFNKKVDPITASQKENYLIMMGKEEIQIKNIQVAGDNIFLRFKKDVIKYITDSVTVYIPVLKDQDGNILDKRLSIEVYQYRELFVQEYTKPASFPDNSIVKDLSPVKDTIPLKEKKERYWMNTPENIKNKKYFTTKDSIGFH